MIPGVAGIASDLGVLPLQRETGRYAMVKLRGIKAHDLKIFAVVIAMAISTPIVGRMCMDTPRGANGGFDFLVALEALVVRQSLAVRMARGTFADSFQLVVPAGEFAGRDLCLRAEREESTRHQQNPACSHPAAQTESGVEFEEILHLQGNNCEVLQNEANFVEIRAGWNPVECGVDASGCTSVNIRIDLANLKSPANCSCGSFAIPWDACTV